MRNTLNPIRACGKCGHKDRNVIPYTDNRGTKILCLPCRIREGVGHRA